MERTFSAGTVILEKNSVSNLFFVIVRGKVKLESDKRTFFLSDSDFFGEEAAFLRKSNPYTVIACEETAIQIFDIKEAREYIFANPPVFFSLFTRNISRTWECIESVNEKHPSYIKFIEKIFPYVKGESGTPVCELSISNDDVAARTGLDLERIKDFISSVEHLGHFKIDSKGKILTVGKKELQKITGVYYENRNSALMTEIKGCGNFPLLNRLQNKESYY